MIRPAGLPSISSRGGRVLRIADGRVNCPRRGDLDVDACTDCRWLVDIEGDDEIRLVCSWVPARIESFEELRRPLV